MSKEKTKVYLYTRVSTVIQIDGYSLDYDDKHYQRRKTDLEDRLYRTYEERQPNGQWLRSIEFKLPILGEDMKLSLDNHDSVETVCLLTRK